MPHTCDGDVRHNVSPLWCASPATCQPCHLPVPQPCHLPALPPARPSGRWHHPAQPLGTASPWWCCQGRATACTHLPGCWGGHCRCSGPSHAPTGSPVPVCPEVHPLWQRRQQGWLQVPQGLWPRQPPPRPPGSPPVQLCAANPTTAPLPVPGVELPSALRSPCVPNPPASPQPTHGPGGAGGQPGVAAWWPAVDTPLPASKPATKSCCGL